MHRLYPLILLAVFAVFLPSCSKMAVEKGPRATVSLKDGTTYSGTVVKTTPTEITVAGDDQTTRTIAVKDVRSIDYAEQAETAPATQATPEAGPAAPEAGPAAAPTRAESPRPTRYHPPESAIQTRTYELRPGTQVAVRTDETIDSAKAVEGQTFAAEVYKDVVDSAGAVVIPHGSNAQIVIRSASKGGRVTGASELVLDLASVSVEGRRYELDTANLQQRGAAGVGKNKRTAEYVGGGAALGAIIGAIAGHGKGAAIGAASGAAAGAATQVITRGKAIRVPAETVLTFRLDKPLRVTPAR